MFYILSQRAVTPETSGYRVSGSLVLSLFMCLGFACLVFILTWQSPTFFFFQGHLFVNELVLVCFSFVLLLAFIVSSLPLFSAAFVVVSESVFLSM